MILRRKEVRGSLARALGGGAIVGALLASPGSLFLFDVFGCLASVAAGAVAGVVFAFVNHWIILEGWTFHSTIMAACGAGAWVAWLIMRPDAHPLAFAAGALVFGGVACLEARDVAPREEMRLDDGIHTVPGSSERRAALSAHLDQSIRRARG